MIKVLSIIHSDQHTLACKFNNGETRNIEIDKELIPRDKYAQQILKIGVFETVQVGELGQLFWHGVAMMKDQFGNLISCEYDLSPKFVYFHSVSINPS